MIRKNRNTGRRQPDSRKLAAVMFADIEGYTLGFQRNEAAAIRQVEDHRNDLEAMAQKHQGEIIQFYGDGSVTIFNSILDAIRCATELQQLSTMHRIPLRIGIHIGDLVVKDGDIYGDAVNLTSRIQTLGIPGSILISKKVVDELASHPEFQYIHLGDFTFKNVRQKLEIYALTTEGLAVPEPLPDVEGSTHIRRRFIVWGGMILLFGTASFIALDLFNQAGKSLGLERIIIPPFKDFTSDTSFAAIGDIASSYITNALNKKAAANFISYESMLRYTNVNLASISQNPALARRMGAERMIKGHYTLTGINKDSLLMWSHIEDLRKAAQSAIPLPDVRCLASDPMSCMEVLIDNLAGYWKSEGIHLFRKPNGKALAAYTQAQNLWADPGKNYQAMAYLREAIRQDPKFIDAYFLLMDALNNDGAYHQEADTITLVRSIFNDLTPREENYLRYYEADLNGRNAEAFQYFLTEHERDPHDLFLTTTGMVMALEYINDPAMVLLLYRYLNPESLDVNACTYCHTTLNMAMQAYASLDSLDQARHLAERLGPYVKRAAQFTRLIGVYLLLNDTLMIDQTIQKAVREGSRWDDEQYYCLITARLAKVHLRQGIAEKYARRALSLFGERSNRTKARCHVLVDELDQARKIYLEEIRMNPENRVLLAELGVIYARESNVLKADEILTWLSETRTGYDYGLTYYYQGRIKAHLGDHDTAFRLLHMALDEGIKFQAATTFQEDPDLMILAGDERFQKLLLLNRYVK